MPRRDAIVAAFPDLLRVLGDFVRALRKDSPGGRKVTPEEWLQIGRDAGVLVENVLR